jgi:hypothetical protein
MKFVLPKCLDPDEVKKTLEGPLKKKKDLLKDLDELKSLVGEMDKYLDGGKCLEPLNDDFKPDDDNDVKQRQAEMKRCRLTDKWEAEMMRRLGKAKDAADSLRKTLEKAKADRDPDIVDPTSAIRYLSQFVVDGRTWIKDVQRAITLLNGKIERAGAELKDAGEAATDAAKGGDAQRMISKTQVAMKELRARPGEKFPFLMCDTREDLFVFVGRDAKGGGAEDKVRAALGEAGKRGTMIRGEVGFADKRFLFISQQLSGGTFATRMQRRLLEDCGKRHPIGVGKDKSAIEAVDEDDYKDPLDYLIAKAGPLMDRAKKCKEIRADTYKKLSEYGVLESKTAASKLANELLERADGAADRHDLATFESLMKRVRTDVIESHLNLKKKREGEKRSFEDESAKVLGRIPKVSVALAKHLDYLKGEPDAKEMVAEATTQRTEFDKLRKALDKLYDDLSKEDKENPFAYKGGWSDAKLKLIEIDAAMVAAEDAMEAQIEKLKQQRKDKEKEEKLAKEREEREAKAKK